MVACSRWMSDSNRSIMFGADRSPFWPCALINRSPSKCRSNGRNPTQLAVAVLVVLRVICQVFSGAHVPHPFLIGAVPVPRCLKALFEIHERTPAGFLHQLFAGQSVAPIVPRP